MFLGKDGKKRQKSKTASVNTGIFFLAEVKILL